MMKRSYEEYHLFFGSLANPNRLRIIQTLRNKPLSVGEISKKSGLEQSQTSHNLKRLERCGMVFPSRQGKYKVYRLNQTTIKPLLSLIDRHTNKYCKHVLGGSR